MQFYTEFPVQLGQDIKHTNGVGPAGHRYYEFLPCCEKAVLLDETQDTLFWDWFSRLLRHYPCYYTPHRLPFS